jgi:hypothetical protein
MNGIKEKAIQCWRNILFWRGAYFGLLIIYVLGMRWLDSQVSKVDTQYKELKQSFSNTSVEVRDSLVNVFHVKKDVAEREAIVIKQCADKFKLDWRKVAAKIKVESNFDPMLISKPTQIGNDAYAECAEGLMQLKPGTAKMLAQECGLDFKEEWLFNDQYNVYLGSFLFYKLQVVLDSDFENSVKAYNCGLPGFYVGLASEQHWRKVQYNYKLLKGERDTVLLNAIQTEEQRRKDAKSGR